MNKSEYWCDRCKESLGIKEWGPGIDNNKSLPSFDLYLSGSCCSENDEKEDKELELNLDLCKNCCIEISNKIKECLKTN